MTSEQCLEGLVNEGRIGESRTKAASTVQKTGVDGRAESCSTHATSMPWPDAGVTVMITKQPDSFPLPSDP